jgi:ribosomal protein S28E/S33
MVLGGKVNHEIVALVQRAGGRAVGLTGSDGDMIRVTRRLVDGQDVGRVGRIVAVNPAPIAIRGRVLGLARAFLPAGSRASLRTAEVIGTALSAAVRNALLYRSLLESIDDLARARREANERKG